MCDTCDWEEDVIQISNILEQVEDLPDRAADFGRSVSEKLESICVWIEKEKHVTAAQSDAIENMGAGVDKWIR